MESVFQDVAKLLFNKCFLVETFWSFIEIETSKRAWKKLEKTGA